MGLIKWFKNLKTRVKVESKSPRCEHLFKKEETNKIKFKGYLSDIYNIIYGEFDEFKLVNYRCIKCKTLKCGELSDLKLFYKGEEIVTGPYSRSYGYTIIYDKEGNHINIADFYIMMLGGNKNGK